MAERWIEDMIARNSVQAPALTKTADAPQAVAANAAPQAKPHVTAARRARRKSEPDSLKPAPPSSLTGNGTETLPAESPSKSTAAPSAPITFAFGNIDSQAVEWLWPGWVPMGKVTVMEGAGDLGKSLLLLDLAARVSTTGLMPDNSQGCAGNVIILSSQDGARDTIRPRLEAAGANLDRVISMTHVLEGEQERPLALPGDLSHVEGAMQKHDPRLVIIDPLTLFAGRAGKVLARLGLAAEKQRCAIVCVAAGRGLLGPARAGLIVAQDPEDEGLRILCANKSNLAARPQSLTWKIEPAGAVCRITWLGVSPYAARELAGPPPTKEAREARVEEKHKVQQAMEMLQDLLKWGPEPVRKCKKMGADGGFSARTVERSAKELGLVVTIERDDVNGGRQFMWARKDWRGGEVMISLDKLAT